VPEPTYASVKTYPQRPAGGTARRDPRRDDRSSRSGAGDGRCLPPSLDL